MTAKAEELLDTFRSLDKEDRTELARFMLESLESPFKDLSDEQWEADLERRYNEIHSGAEIGVPAEEVFAHLAAKYG